MTGWQLGVGGDKQVSLVLGQAGTRAQLRGLQDPTRGFEVESTGLFRMLAFASPLSFPGSPDPPGTALPCLDHTRRRWENAGGASSWVETAKFQKSPISLALLIGYQMLCLMFPWKPMEGPTTPVIRS